MGGGSGDSSIKGGMRGVDVSSTIASARVVDRPDKFTNGGDAH